MVVATSVVHVIFLIVIVGFLLGLAAICALKGKWVFFVLGFFSGLFWIIGASRLGKPNSYWARHRYEDLEIAEAEQHFSRRPIPHWGGSPFREGVEKPKPVPDDADLGKMQ